MTRTVPAPFRHSLSHAQSRPSPKLLNRQGAKVAKEISFIMHFSTGRFFDVLAFFAPSRS